MPTRIAVVALEMNKLDLKYNDFIALPFLERVQKLVVRIHDVCKHLQQTETSETKWLIAWSEHDPSHEYESPSDKKYFKQQMQLLTTTYPQLAIIAGTIKSSQRYDDAKIVDKLPAIKAAYAAHNWIPSKELDCATQVSQYERHLNKTMSFRCMGLFTTVIRNTTYVFANGNCIARHDKLAPFRETDNIFQVAKGRNVSGYINISFTDGVKIPIGIEICREHYIGTLQRECSEKKLKRPLIHFVLSNSIDAYPSRMVGDYFIHVDSYTHPTCDKMDAAKYPNVNLACYRTSAHISDSPISQVQILEVDKPKSQKRCRI